jgi:uncharacterized protein
MTIYLDSSALIPLVQRDANSEPLLRFLGLHRAEPKITSALSRTEVVRAMSKCGRGAVALAQRAVGRCYQIPLSADLLDRSALYSPGQRLRTAEAIHLTSARVLGDQLHTFVTYDERLFQAALTWKLPVYSPSDGGLRALSGPKS